MRREPWKLADWNRWARRYIAENDDNMAEYLKTIVYPKKVRAG